MVGANHNDNNKPAPGKPFDKNKTGADQTRGLISTLAAHYSLGKALHISETLFSKDGRICNVFKRQPYRMFAHARISSLLIG